MTEMYASFQKLFHRDNCHFCFLLFYPPQIIFRLTSQREDSRVLTLRVFFDSCVFTAVRNYIISVTKVARGYCTERAIPSCCQRSTVNGQRPMERTCIRRFLSHFYLLISSTSSFTFSSQSGPAVPPPWALWGRPPPLPAKSSLAFAQQALQSPSAPSPKAN